MCMKHEHFGSSLSGALIVNLWLSFDYRFDYCLFVHQFGLNVSHGIQDHLSRIVALFVIVVFLAGHIVFLMLSYNVTDTWDPSLLN